MLVEILDKDEQYLLYFIPNFPREDKPLIELFENI
jgi:hypothetical protein